jgi:hypothetical protein
MNNSRSKPSKLPGRSQVSRVAACVIIILLIAGPLAVNSRALPLGWELQKVAAFQVAGILSIIVVAAYLTYTVIQTRTTITHPDRIIAVVATTTLLAIISTFLSPYIIPELSPFDLNPVYSLMEVFLSPPYLVSIYGNIFRNFGLITFMCVLGIVLLSSLVTKRALIEYILLAFIVSAVIQSGIGIWQFIELIRVGTLSPFSGTWVHGTFGQANFFAGHLLVGLASALYFLRYSSNNNLLFIIPILMTICGLFVSFSIGAVIIMLFLIVGAVIYELVPVTMRVSVFATLAVIAVTAGIGILAYAYLKPHPENYRMHIWRNTIDLYLVIPYNEPTVGNVTRAVFGSGFDTLGNVFIEAGRLKGNYVDRAHNVFLDTLASLGIAGLAAFLTLLAIAAKRTLEKIDDPLVFYLGLFAAIWIARSFIHTSSIINIAGFAIIIGLLLGLTRTQQSSTTKTRHW